MTKLTMTELPREVTMTELPREVSEYNITTKFDNRVNINCIYPVYISMTTIPERMSNTYKIIKSTLNNLSGFEKLILNVPIKYQSWEMDKLNLTKLESINDPRFILNRTNDFGPATKIIPSLSITPNECIIIVCDDDCYHYEAFKIAAESQEKDRSKSFTFWKYTYNGLDIPQGVDLITFWKPNMLGFESYAKRVIKYRHCFFVDDMIIGSYLSQNGISIEQLDRKWKWPWIPNCFGKESKFSLNKQKGEFSRESCNKNCFKLIKNIGK